MSATLTTASKPRAEGGAPLAGWRSLGELLYRKLRLKNPWSYKAPFLISLPYFMILVGHVPPGKAILAILASLCTIAGIAGLAYFLNDLADIEKDRLAGKPNAVAGLSRAARVLVAGVFAVAALAPWLYLPFTRVSGVLLAAELTLFVMYCFPPFRLKERGVLGVVTDSAYAHTLPAILAVVTFGLLASEPYADFEAYLLALGLWQLVLGVRNIVLHQIQDHDGDVASGTRTLATTMGPERLTRVLERWIVPLEVIGFAAFAVIVSRSLPVFIPAYLMFVVLTLVRTRVLGTRPAPTTSRERLNVYLDDFYVDWLPLIVLGGLVWNVPELLPLLLLHLMIFRSGLRHWGEELRGYLGRRWRAATDGDDGSAREA